MKSVFIVVDVPKDKFDIYVPAAKEGVCPETVEDALRKRFILVGGVGEFTAISILARHPEID